MRIMHHAGARAALIVAAFALSAAAGCGDNSRTGAGTGGFGAGRAGDEPGTASPTGGGADPRGAGTTTSSGAGASGNSDSTPK